MENLDLNGDPNQVIDISEYCKDKVFDNLVEGPGKHLACLLKVLYYIYSIEFISVECLKN